MAAASALRDLLELDQGDLAKGFMLIGHEKRSALAQALAAAVFADQAGMSSLDSLITKLDAHLAALRAEAERGAQVTGEVAARVAQAAVDVDKVLAPVVEALQAL